MLDLQAAALTWRCEGRPAVVVEVVRSRGSVPRDAGTRMLVAVDEVLGSVGGGHLELQAIVLARGMLTHPCAPHEQTLALGPSLGQCCGGTLVLRYAALADADPLSWPAPQPLFRLQLYGAGHVGRAIVHLLAELPCTVNWIDEREAEFAATPLPPHIRRLCVEPVAAEAAASPPGAFHLVLTHSHDLDLAICQAIVERGDFGWFGLIGSRTKRVRFERRLAERGASAPILARLVCPIGLPGIPGKQPELIALSVVAQLLQAAGTAAGR